MYYEQFSHQGMAVLTETTADNGADISEINVYVFVQHVDDVDNHGELFTAIDYFEMGEEAVIEWHLQGLERKLDSFAQLGITKQFIKAAISDYNSREEERNG